MRKVHIEGWTEIVRNVPFLQEKCASGGSQSVDQGIVFPMEQSKEMNGVKFKTPQIPRRNI